MSEPMRILVTGATGGIGRHTIRAISTGHPGATLAATARPGSEHRLSHVPTVLSADLARPLELSLVISSWQPNIVVHLGAITGAACEADPAAAWTVNVTAVEELVSALAGLPGERRVVFASTAAVYGTEVHRPVAEIDETAGASVYAQTKLEAERVLRAASSDASLESVSLRIFNAYGPGLTQSLVHKLLTADKEHPVTMSGSATVFRDYIYVDDVARAITMAATIPVPAGGTTLNVGTGVATSGAGLVDLLGLRQTVHADRQGEEGAPSWSVARTELAESALGFRARSVAEVVGSTAPLT